MFCPFPLSLCFCLCVSIGKIPFIHVGNQVVSELGPIVQFTKAKVSNTYIGIKVFIEFNTAYLCSGCFNKSSHVDVITTHLDIPSRSVSVFLFRKNWIHSR